MTLAGLLLVSFGNVVVNLKKFNGLRFIASRNTRIAAVHPASIHGDGTTRRDEHKQFLSSAAEEQHTEEEDTYTLVVVCCRSNISWLQEVPSSWRIVVYDKCDQYTDKNYHKLNPTSRKNLIRHTSPNQGPEECNGYLDYMHDYYDNLTSVTVFMHDDGLWPYSTHKGWDAHTPFTTFEPIVNATKQFVTKDRPFLHLGVTSFREEWGTDWYHGKAMKILWPYFAKLDPKSDPPVVTLDLPPKDLTFKPSANFAVHKEQLQTRPKATYHALLQHFRFVNRVNRGGDTHMVARQLCCAMERMWHIFFGEPAIMPREVMAMELLNVTHHYTDGP
jgi:Protein of unknown function (DUF3431)